MEWISPGVSTPLFRVRILAGAPIKKEFMAKSKSKCKHCGTTFTIADKPKGWMANHSRWCDENPKRIEYCVGSLKAIEAMNSKRKETGLTNQYTKAKIEGKEVPAGYYKGKVGAFKGKKHTEETKKLMQEKALASPHRRLRKKMIEYNGVMLDSTWELALAKRLDALEIIWIRPDPLKWIDKQGQAHNYFADFYLEEYNLYLDPKNPYAIKAQKDKIECLMEQYKNIFIIDSIEDCKNYTPENLKK